MEDFWKKPVIVFYRERRERESKAFLVIKARSLAVSKKDGVYIGSISDFFPLMGDMDYLTSEKGDKEKYVFCWFNDEEDDLDKAWLRLIGVTLSDVQYITDDKGKKTYQAKFQALHGKTK
jgi:hypothetical protein